jgi:hypothetical protein
MCYCADGRNQTLIIIVKTKAFPLFLGKIVPAELGNCAGVARWARFGIDPNDKPNSVS